LACNTEKRTVCYWENKRSCFGCGDRETPVEPKKETVDPPLMGGFRKFINDYFILLFACVLAGQGFAFLGVHAYMMASTKNMWGYSIIWAIGAVVLVTFVSKTLKAHKTIIDRLDGKLVK
jgi:hypothetical protein